MSLDSHLDSLRRRHDALDRDIREAQSTPAVPDYRIAEMKRRKLQLKDDITRGEERRDH